MTTTENIALADFVEGQKLAATKLNSNQDILDSLVQFWLIDSTPPTTPPVSGVDNGHAYIVPASATGDWATHDGEIAVWRSGWTFLIPQPGTIAWDTSNHGRFIYYTGDRWQAFQATRVAELTDSTGGTPASELVAISASYVQSEIRDNQATLNAKIDAIMDALILAGLMEGDHITEVVDEDIGVTEVVDADLNP